MTRTVDLSVLPNRICEALQAINYHTPEKTMTGLRRACACEVAPTARQVLSDIIANRELASREQVPMCQDTGVAIVFAEIGQNVRLTGGILRERIDEGVRRAYEPLRKSVIAEPLFDRRNTGDNTPAIVHVELLPGEECRFVVGAKGFGAENMSRARLLPPAAGIEGVKEEVLEVVEDAGPNACPPIVVGVGLGGTLEVCSYLAKKALMREVGERHPDPRYAELEEQLLEIVNKTGIGAQGIGGVVTALDVRLEFAPTHIGSLPIAVNLDCHLQRKVSFVL